MSARSDILGKIASSLGEKSDDAARRKAVADRLAGHARGTVPQRATGTATEMVARFIQQANGVAATVERLGDFDDAPAAIAAYLTRENLPAAFRMAPQADLQGIDWSTQPALTISEGASDGHDLVGLNRAVCGVSETGTLVMASGPDSPTTLNFLPETEVVMIRADEIVGGYEDAWDTIRQRTGPNGTLPRTVNMITGPSRTGDIEQTIYLGAHGPRRLHILIVGDV
ncbi:MAG: LUD domain-containing protein [Alphaproteobacteria bacterium]